MAVSSALRTSGACERDVERVTVALDAARGRRRRDRSRGGRAARQAANSGPGLQRGVHGRLEPAGPRPRIERRRPRSRVVERGRRQRVGGHGGLDGGEVVAAGGHHDVAGRVVVAASAALGATPTTTPGHHQGRVGASTTGTSRSTRTIAGGQAGHGRLAARAGGGDEVAERVTGCGAMGDGPPDGGRSLSHRARPDRPADRAWIPTPSWRRGRRAAPWRSPDGPTVSRSDRRRGLVTRLAALGERAGATRRRRWAVQLEVDPLALLGERAAIAGLHRRGTTSVGGATRLLARRRRRGSRCRSRAPTTWRSCPRGWSSTCRPRTRGERSSDGGERTSVARGGRTRLGSSGLPVGGARRGAPAGGHRSPAGGATLAGPVRPATRLAGHGRRRAGFAVGGPAVRVPAAGRRARRWSRSSRPAVPTVPAAGRAAFFDLLNAGQAIGGRRPVDRRRREALARLVGGGRRRDRGVAARAPSSSSGIDARVGRRGGGPSRLAVDHRPRPRGAGTRLGRVRGRRGRRGGARGARTSDGPVFCADAVADPITGVVAAGAVLAGAARGRPMARSTSRSRRWRRRWPARRCRSTSRSTSRRRAPVPATAPGPRLGEHNAALGG